MERFFKATGHHRIYKLAQDKDGQVMLFWVSVWKDASGSFQHGRGGDVMPSWEKGLEACQLMAVEATEPDYINGLKDYFAIDKKIREAFIEKYQL